MTSLRMLAKAATILAVLAAALGFGIVASATAQSSDSAEPWGNWSVTVERFNGQTTTSDVSIRPKMEVVCVPQPNDQCLYRWAAVKDGGFESTGSPGHLPYLYEAPNRVRFSGGMVTFSHRYFPGKLIDDETLFEGDRMHGVWKEGAEAKGNVTWLRQRPRVTQISFSTIGSGWYKPEIVRQRASQPVVATGTYVEHDWSPIAKARANRPVFSVRVYGDNLWGLHRIEFPDAPQYEPFNPRPILAPGSDRVIGAQIEIALWPGATPGIKTMTVNGQSYQVDVRVAGFPGPREDQVEDALLQLSMPKLGNELFAPIFPTGKIYVDVENRGRTTARNVRITLTASAPMIQQANAEGVFTCANQWTEGAAECRIDELTPAGRARIALVILPFGGANLPTDLAKQFTSSLTINATVVSDQAETLADSTVIRFKDCASGFLLGLRGNVRSAIDSFERDSSSVAGRDPSFIREKRYSYDGGKGSGLLPEAGLEIDEIAKQAVRNGGPDDWLKNARSDLVRLFRLRAELAEKATADTMICTADADPAVTRQIAVIGEELSAARLQKLRLENAIQLRRVAVGRFSSILGSTGSLSDAALGGAMAAFLNRPKAKGLDEKLRALELRYKAEAEAGNVVTRQRAENDLRTLFDAAGISRQETNPFFNSLVSNALQSSIITSLATTAEYGASALISPNAGKVAYGAAGMLSLGLNVAEIAKALSDLSILAEFYFTDKDQALAVIENTAHMEVQLRRYRDLAAQLDALNKAYEDLRSANCTCTQRLGD